MYSCVVLYYRSPLPALPVATLGDWVTVRGVTIRYPHDTIRIAILESRYDTYRDTW